MELNLFVTKLLKKHFLNECTTVGPTNLKDIVESTVNFKSPKFGSSLDLENSIQILIVASTFIKIVVDLYITIKKEKSRNPSKAEIKERLIIKEEINQRIEISIQDEIIKSIIHELKEKGED